VVGSQAGIFITTPASPDRIPAKAMPQPRQGVALVNLQRIEKDQGLRIIDFLSGTVYALGGDIQRIGTDIFLCVPDTVEVDGAISDYYYEDQQ
jgi:FtsZ-interacting cell division protein YlmF